MVATTDAISGVCHQYAKKKKNEKHISNGKRTRLGSDSGGMSCSLETRQTYSVGCDLCKYCGYTYVHEITGSMATAASVGDNNNRLKYTNLSEFAMKTMYSRSPKAKLSVKESWQHRYMV